MIDHISLRCRDYEASKRFYVKALAPIGYSLLAEYPGIAGFGANRKPDFWLTAGEIGTPAHVAFHALDRTVVDAFHRAALKAGARDNGGPGLRPMYHRDYYGAFVLDPDGHNIEAVCHLAPAAKKRAAVAKKAPAKRPAAKKAPVKRTAAKKKKTRSR